ncbi:hypothetical protein [Castellaniella sp.]|uniref:hypothetical protein n=1 Tax=Castellaniella sp. TaxID=1955812 RepID=UPI002AFF6565|nr:hypothetical protein [Castellaniella sp.]
MESFPSFLRLHCLWFIFFGFQVRRLGAWSKRQDGPKDRVWFFLLMLAIVGFGFGSFVQPLWDTGIECQVAGQSLVSCVLSPM